MQRFDLAAQAVYMERGGPIVGDNRPDWYGNDPRAGTHRALRLLDQPNAVIFINELKLEALPKELQEKIRQKVSEGTGLVLVGGDNKQPLFGGATLKGRVAVLPSREKLLYELGWEARFDYQMQEQGRKLLWAARREPKAALAIKVEPEIARQGLATHPARLTWSGMPAGATVRLSLRHQDGDVRTLKTVPASASGTAAITLPLAREGRYHLDAIAGSGSATVNWAVAEFRVTAGQHVEAVSLDKDWAEPGEQLRGTVKVNGAGKLEVRLLDKRGRILARATPEVTGGTASFAFPIEAWMPMLLRVSAVLGEASGDVSSAYKFARVTQRHRGQFHFMMWNGPGADLMPYGYESLARHGVSLVLGGGPPPLCMSESELSWVPYAQSFRDSSHTTTAMLDPKTGWLKSGCVYDTEKMKATVARTLAAAQRPREHGVFAYSLGDENAVRGSCLSPYCLHAYRRYLKDTYGDIAALNREWDSKYASFEEIELLKDDPLPGSDAPAWFREYYQDRRTQHMTDNEGAKGADLVRQVDFGDINDEIRALRTGNFPRWFDRQAFQNQTYVEWSKIYQKAFRTIDPQAWTGFEGVDSFAIRKFTTRSRQGGDLDMFVRTMDYFGPYNDPANEVVRSIAKPGFPRGNWMGYDPEMDKQLKQYWGQVTDGMNMIQWWRWDNVNGYHGYLKPDLSPFPATAEMIRDTQVVRDGLGDLLMTAGMHDDGVAMLYSMPSTYIAHFDGNETFGDYKRDHDVWRGLLHGAGLQFRYVTDRMLRLGEFDGSRYKVLLLPLAYAIGPKEAEVIREFVRKGGTVIADLRPGMYDDHLKRGQAGMLDDLFGIRRKKEDRAAVGIDRLGIDGELNGSKVRMQWGNWHGHDVYPQAKVDASVEVSTGKSLGQAFRIHYWSGLNTPVAIVNQFGQGKAVLLNWSVFETPGPTGGFLKQLLAAAGVKAAIGLKRPDGGSVEGVEVTRWSNGSSGLVALFGNYDGPVTVSLPEARLVQDLRQRKSLGKTATFTTTLRANRATFFALQAAEEARPEIHLPGATAKRGDTLSASVAIPNATGKHPVLIRATAPDGKQAEWLDRNLLVDGQPAEWKLPIAWNDAVGDWTVKVVDLLTNQSTTAKLRVQ